MSSQNPFRMFGNAIGGLVGSILGVPDAPAVPTPAPPSVSDTPSAATPNVQAAAQAARRRERIASGRAATMLSSGGTAGGTADIGTKKLLGQ